MTKDYFNILYDKVETTTLKNAALGIANAEKNLPHIEHTIKDLHNTAAGRDCLIVGAGPSLLRQRSIPRLKPVWDKFVVVATDGSLGHCLREGLVPDYVVSLDPHSDRIVRWFGDDELTQEKLADDYFRRQDIDAYLNTDEVQKNRELLDLVNSHCHSCKVVLSTSAPENVLRRCQQAKMEVYWWNPIYDDYTNEDSVTRNLYQSNKVPCMNAGGNCGSAAWVLAAKILGVARTVLVGMDFAYYADTSIENSQYYRLFEAFMSEEELAGSFKTLTNPHLNADFYTDPAYFWYREGFLELSSQVAGCTIVNATEGGILFGDRIEWQSADEVVAEKQGGMDRE